MMQGLQTLYSRYFTLQYNTLNLIERQRAYGLLLINWTVLVIWAFYMVFIITPRTLSGEQPLNIVTLLVGFGLPIIIAINYNLIQSGRGNAAAILFVALLVVSIAPFLVIAQSNGGILLAMLPVIAAGVLLNRRSFLIVMLIISLAFVGHVAVISSLTMSVRSVPARELSLTVPLISISVVLSTLFFIVFSGSSERVAKASSNELRHLRAMGDFANAPNDDEENKVITRALRLLEETLGYRVAQYYPVDSEGRPLRRLRLNPERSNLLSTPNLTGASLFASAARGQRGGLQKTDSDEAATYLAASSPGNTANAALFLPVILNNRVVGVLDVQSARADAFDTGLIEALEILAQALSRRIATSHDLIEVQRRSAEQNQIIDRARKGMISRGTANARSGDALSGAFAYQLGDVGGLTGLQQIPASALPNAVRETLARGEVHIERVTTENGLEQGVKIPIALRGQLFGAMSFVIPVEQSLSARQLEIARTVANRLATALENTRLYEQTQTQAARERKANAIGSELLTTTDIDVLMEIAARTFNDALGAVQTQIYLDPRHMEDSAFTEGGLHPDSHGALAADAIIVGGMPHRPPSGSQNGNNGVGTNGHQDDGHEPGDAHS